MSWLLIGLCAAVFVVELGLGAELEPTIRRWGLVPADVRDALGAAAGPAALITVLTSMFLHAGWLHLLANTLYLAVFGPPVEKRLGAMRFGLLFVVSGLVGGTAYLLAQPTSQTPAIGASGAIGGVLAAYLVLFPRSTLGSLAPVLFLPVVEDAPAMLLVVVWLATQLLSSVASLTATTGLAWWAHLGGFASGLALAAVLRRTPRRLTR